MPSSKYVGEVASAGRDKISCDIWSAGAKNTYELLHTECNDQKLQAPPWRRPGTNWELELLQLGITRIRANAKASEDLRAAEQAACAQGKGRWAGIHFRDSPVPLSSRTARSPMENRSFNPLIRRLLMQVIFVLFGVAIAGGAAYYFNGWKGVFDFNLFDILGGVIAGAVGFLIWQHTRYVELIMIGAPDAGKSWLVNGLLQDSKEKLDKASFLAIRAPSPAQVAHFRGEPFKFAGRSIYPTLIDNPGQKPLDQSSSMYEYRGIRESVARFLGQRRVWIINVGGAPRPKKGNTPPSNLVFDLNDAGLRAYLGDQSSSFALPHALIRSAFVRRPDALFVVFNKMDAFSSASEAEEQLRQHFKSQLIDIQSACRCRKPKKHKESCDCEKMSIPNRVFFCGALSYGNIDQLKQALSEVLFPK
jgi:hypothetical protein